MRIQSKRIGIAWDLNIELDEVCNLNALWDTNVREETPTYSNEVGGTLVDDGPPRQNI
jgi:hypothetical protein